MTKQSGLGDGFWIGGTDLSGNVLELKKISGSVALLDVTPINAYAHVRLGGLRDGTMQLTSAFDPLVEHPVLSALPLTDVICTYARGTTLGAPAASCNGKQIDYDPTRATSGMLTLDVEVQADGYGLEWGSQLTPGMRTDTAATNGSTVDQGAGTAYGAQAYLHVAALTGTDVTVQVQHSTDGTTWTTLLAFPQVTGGAPLAARASVTNTTTVNRYVRASTVTSGGFSSCRFAVVLTRNPIAGQVF